MSRIYFALWPDETTRIALRVAAKLLLVKYPIQGRPTPIENLHLTLAFLRAGTDDHEASARAAADKLRRSPFKLSIDVAGSTDGTWWMGSQRYSDAFSDVQQELMEYLDSANVPHGDRFAPRISFLHGAQSDLPLTMIRPIEWETRDITLIRCHPAAAGSVHRVVGRWPLQAA